MARTATSSPAETLPKAARVRKRGECLAIQNRGKRRATRHFLLVYRPSRGTQPRLGITVTKKIGGAVIRNRVKRAVRETFRRLKTSIPAIDLVVIARKGSGELDGATVRAEIEPALLELPGESRP